jgi:hypothetical protein
MKIALEGGSLVISGRRGGAVRFDDIAEIEAEKVGKITYDELFLIVRDHLGSGLTLGELDEGFAEAEEALRERLPGFPSDWRDLAEESSVGARERVWPKQP